MLKAWRLVPAIALNIWNVWSFILLTQLNCIVLWKHVPCINVKAEWDAPNESETGAAFVEFALKNVNNT